MFAIAFDMVVADIREHYPKGISSAYTEIAKTLVPFGFERIRGSVNLARDGDLTNLYRAVDSLRSLGWFRRCARDVRGFKIEDWSNFTGLIREKLTTLR